MQALKRKYETEIIDGIKVVYLTDKKKLPESVLKNLLKLIKLLNEEYRGKYKRIEVGTIASFYLEGKKRGRFIPLSTMHLARLLKK